MKNYKKVVLVGFVGVMTAVMLNAKERYHFKNSHHDIRGIFQELDLSEAQKELLKSNRKSMREMMHSQKQKLSSKDFITIEGVDREFLIQEAQKRANTKADFLEKTFDVLTYEQKEEFIRLLESKL